MSDDNDGPYHGLEFPAAQFSSVLALLSRPPEMHSIEPLRFAELHSVYRLADCSMEGLIGTQSTNRSIDRYIGQMNDQHCTASRPPSCILTHFCLPASLPHTMEGVETLLALKRILIL